jgi:hypothetical protein
MMANTNASAAGQTVRAIARLLAETLRYAARAIIGAGGTPLLMVVLLVVAAALACVPEVRHLLSALHLV